LTPDTGDAGDDACADSWAYTHTTEEKKKAVKAKLTGTPTARGLFVTFLPSRPLKWGFRMFFRSNFPTFRPWGPRPTNYEHPFIDFGLASSPKSQLLKIAKTQKP
jgi:hypothetical protein